MIKQSLKGNLLLLSTVTLVLSIGLATPSAFAAEGDILRQIDCAGSGVGVAFDGTTLYWPKGFGSFTLGTCDVDGNVGADLPIIGLNDAITTVAYDITRNLLWAATSNLGGGDRDIYQIDTTTGQSTFMFVMNSDGLGLTDGLAYDGQDDTLWITGDVSTTISHYETDGTAIAVNVAVPGTGQISGVAAGIDVLYLGHDGQNIITKHAKSDLSLLATFNTGQGRTEDLECDPNTFPGFDAIWSKDANDSVLVAYEVADGTCPLGGGGEAIGGSILPIDASALLIAGIFTNAIWIAPVLAGAAGTAAFYLKTRKN